MADQKPISFADLMVSAVQSRLCILGQAHDCVDFWKVGKLNHNKAVEQSVLGPKFQNDATAADSYCVFDAWQVAVVGEEMIKYGMGCARCAA